MTKHEGGALCSVFVGCGRAAQLDDAPQSGERPAVVACHCQILWTSSSSWAPGFFTCQELMNRLLTQKLRFKQPLGEIQIISSWACSSNTAQTSWGTAESRLCSSMYQTHYTWSRLFYPLSTLCLNKQFWHRDRFLLWTLDSAWYDDTLISDYWSALKTWRWGKSYYD